MSLRNRRRNQYISFGGTILDFNWRLRTDGDARVYTGFVRDNDRA